MVQDTSIIEENEELIAEMLESSERVNIQPEEPIVHKGDEEVEAPMVAKTISSAGYIYVWDRERESTIPILYYMIPQQLRKRGIDGKPRFTRKKPEGYVPKGKGTIKCMLHEDSPLREDKTFFNLRECKKSNITNPHALVQHMRLKHPQEWKLIEDTRIEKERQEDRALQREILQRVGQQVENKPVVQVTEEAPLYVSDKDKVRGRPKK